MVSPKWTISCFGGTGLGCDRMVSGSLCRSVRLCRRGRRTPKGGGFTRHFGNSLALDSIETLKLSECEREQS
ncbi:hypothetical protein DVH24_039635 [Malus domestica]|uniref:Uncharacterized protein n=1 Tax=Malus domestica TaxID=3750 RepID=A0A498I663_MALDO|nr:hypothetical protein DVH24_039635 [Malus domestica]